MNVRVKAPKTKEEPYPDYDEEETKSAEQISRLCIRETPLGARYRAKDSGTSEKGGEDDDGEEGEIPVGSSDSKGGGEGSEESGVEEKTPKNTISKRNMARGGKSDVRRRDSDSDGFIKTELRKPILGATSRSISPNKPAKSVGRRVAKRAVRSIEQDRNRRFRAYGGKQNSQSIITSADYRARRAMLRNKSSRRSKRKRRNYYSEGVSTSEYKSDQGQTTDYFSESSSDSEVDNKRRRKNSRATPKRSIIKSKSRRPTSTKRKKSAKSKPVRRKRVVTFPSDDSDSSSGYSSSESAESVKKKKKNIAASAKSKPAKQKTKTDNNELDSDFDCTNFWTASNTKE